MTLKRDMAVVWRSTSDLSSHPNNPRTHSDEQLEQLYASVSRFGWTVPLIVDENLTILAGHGRWEMAERNNIKKVPTIQVVGLTDEEKRAYLIADNRLSENADWNIPQLLAEIDFLSDHAIEADTLGFSDADILAYQSSVDDTGFPLEPIVEAAPATPPSGPGQHLIESHTDPTQVQQSHSEPPEHGGDMAASVLVPFSVMLTTDDRERAFTVLDRAGGTMAEALMVVIDAFDADQFEESANEQQQ